MIDSVKIDRCTLSKEEEIIEFFEKYGIVILRDAITPSECEKCVQEIWSHIETK